MNLSVRILQKYRFFFLVLSVFFFAFTFAFLLCTSLVSFIPEANSVHSDLRNSAILKQGNAIYDTSQFHILPDQIDSLVEGNFIRGVNAKEPIQINGESSKQFVNTPPEIASMLVAGTVSGNKSFARAVIKAKDKEEAEEYKVGQKLGDWEILKIGWHSIQLGAANSIFTVEIGETIDDAIKKQVSSDGAMPKEAIKEEAAIFHKPTTLSRTDIERILKNPASIYENARFAPNIELGKINGMKIYQVARKHIFSQLGAENGDIIKRVNGMPLGETEKMLEIWSAIKVAQKIQVDLERKHEIHTFTFLARN